MDELHEKLNRVFTILKFIFAGPFILILSVFVDTINFFINLFYEPILTTYKENKGKVTENGLDILLECTK